MDKMMSKRAIGSPDGKLLPLPISITEHSEHVTLKDLAYHLDKLFSTDEIGTFRVRDLPNSNRMNKRQIALDFKSGYDAMYAQRLLDGKPYSLPDGDLKVLRARVTNDPDLMTSRSPTPPRTKHTARKERSSSLDEDIPVAEMSLKQLQKADLKMDAQLSLLEKKKKVLMTERELYLERQRLLAQLQELPDTENTRTKKRKSESSDFDSSDQSRKIIKTSSRYDSDESDQPKRKSKTSKVKKRSTKSKRTSSAVIEVSSSLKGVRHKSSRPDSEDRSSEETKSSRKSRRRSSVEGKKKTSRYHKDSFELMDTLPPRSRSSRHSEDSLPIATSSRVKSGSIKRKCSIETLSSSSEEQDKDRCKYVESRFRRDKLREKSPSPQRRSVLRGGSPSPHRRSVLRGRSPSPYRRSVHRERSPSPYRRSVHRERSPSPYRRSVHRERSPSPYRRSVHHERSPSHWRSALRGRSPSPHRRIMLHGKSPSPSNRRRRSELYDSSSMPGPSHRAIEYRPNISEAYSERYNPSPRAPSKDKRHIESITVDMDLRHKNEMIRKQGGKKLLESEQSRIKREAQEKEDVLKTKKDLAIKELMLQNEKHFNQLCSDHKISDVEKKTLLKNLYEILVSRMNRVDIEEEEIVNVSNLVLHYRCRYSKTEDNDLVTDLFKTLVSTRSDDAELGESSSKQFWNDIDNVLQEFELDMLTEDVKPKIEELEEGITNITIQLNWVPVTPTNNNQIINHKIKQENTGQESLPLDLLCESNESGFTTLEEYYASYNININVDQTRRNKFFITTKKIMKDMKHLIRNYNTYVDGLRFSYVLQMVLEKRISELVVGKEYMKAKILYDLYREKYPQKDDYDFVTEVLYDIYAGLHNDDKYAEQRKADDANSQNFEIKNEGDASAAEQAKKDPNVEIKKEGDASTTEKVEKDIKKEKVVLKTEKTGGDKVEQKNTQPPIASNKEAVKSENGNDEDILVVEPKLEVIDLSDTEESPATNQIEQRATTKNVKKQQGLLDKYVVRRAPVDDDVLDISISSEDSMIERKPQVVGNDNDIICLSDPDDPIVLTDDECLAAKVKQQPKTRRSTKNLENCNISAIKEKNATVKNEQNLNKNNSSAVEEDVSSDDTLVLDNTDLSINVKSEVCNEETKTNEQRVETGEINNEKDMSDTVNVDVETTKISSKINENTTRTIDQVKQIETTNTGKDCGSNDKSNVTTEKNPDDITKEMSKSCEERNRDFSDDFSAETVESIGNYLASTNK